ncbi:sigma-w pathway protein ysdB [Bacillus sp. 1P06AnD]|uniref:sigma-w pathway protein ysdB n=1 Tax=Bacillus sp. 1P06AnD TaxID=3132208 RepID=UPI0039A0AA4C
MVLLMSLIFTLLLILFLYCSVGYIMSPARRLNKAKRQRRFYLLDDFSNPMKNFLLTYKGFLMEGEKYADRLESGNVVTIHIWHCQQKAVNKLTDSDIRYIEDSLNSHYPEAEIEWKIIYPDD